MALTAQFVQRFDLSGRRALVTVRPGIGAGIARALASAGASVVITVETRPGRAPRRSWRGNCTTQRRAMCATVETASSSHDHATMRPWWTRLSFGRAHRILVNCAGIQHAARCPTFHSKLGQSVRRRLTSCFVLSQQVAQG